MPGPGWGFSNQVLRACRAQEGAGRDGRWRALPVTTILLSRRSWPRTTGRAVLSDLDVLRVACIAQRRPVSWDAMTRVGILLVPPSDSGLLASWHLCPIGLSFYNTRPHGPH